MTHDRDKAIDKALHGLNGNGNLLPHPANGKERYESNGVTVFPKDIAGVGGRGELASRLHAMPSERLQGMIDDPEMQDRFIAALRYGIDRNDRTCMNLYAQAAKLVGQQLSLSVQIVNAIGAPAERARASVQAFDRVEAMPADVKARKMAAWLENYCRERGFDAPVFPDALVSAEVEP